MSKEELMKFKGQIVEILPNTLFRIQLETGSIILGHICGRMRKNRITVLMGDKVDVEMSIYDLSKGRICFRHK